ncbi:hypothetical protein J6V85_01995 [Candidatus Saccharibacteria bacterium]|nr:hypothetical protein [Candidatus Saccharibacteria bacterium]
MDSHVTVNIVEPDSSILVPNTGGARMGELSLYEMGAIGLGAAALLIIILGIVIAAMKKKKDHRIFEKNKTFRIGMKKRTVFGIIALLILCGAAGLIVDNSIEQKDEVSAEGIEDFFDNTLTISTTDINIAVELDDKDVFSYVSSDVTIKSSTAGGYSLFVYADEPNLVNQKANGMIKSIPFSEENLEGRLLDENTWGFAVEKPQDKKSAVWYGLPTSSDDALEFRSRQEPTPENDKLTFYYGVYVTPDLPYGAYEGSTVNYLAVANLVEPEVTFVYSGDDIFFDEERTIRYNAVGYAPVCEDSIDQEKGGRKVGNDCEWRRVAGKYKEPVVSAGQSLYSDAWYIGDSGLMVHEEEELLDLLNDGLGEELSGDIVSIVGYVVDYFTITYDANGGYFIKICSVARGGECGDTATSVSIRYYFDEVEEDYFSPMDDITQYSFEHPNDELSFLGWSENPLATNPTYYYNQHIPYSLLEHGMEIKLYAVWSDNVPLAYDE